MKADLRVRSCRALCLLTLVFGLLCVMDSQAQDVVEADQPKQAPAALDAERYDFKGGVLVLDRQLLEHRVWIAPLLEEEFARARASKPLDRDAINRAAKQIVDEAYDMLGLAKDTDAYDQAIAGRTLSLVRSESPAYRLAEKVSVYVLKLDTAKAYLRAGGKLPFSTYSQADNRASINTGVMFNQHDQLLPGLILLEEMMAEPGGSFDATWFRRILRASYLYPKDSLCDLLFKHVADLPPKNPDQTIRPMSMYLAASGLWTTIFREQTQLYEDEHTAWFTNGMPFVLTEHLLRQIKQERAVGMLYQIKTGGGDPNLGLPDVPNRGALLRYRPGHLVLLKTSEYHQKLEDYRYAASILEAQKLLKGITPKRLPELMQVLSEQPIDTTAKLESAINEAFDYDIGARLDLYQPEQTLEEMYRQAIENYMQSRDAGDMTRAVINLIRAHEFQIGQALADQPNVYPPLFKLVSNAKGEREAAAAICQAWWIVMHRQDQPPSASERLDASARWLLIAMQLRKPQLANGLIAAIDEQPLTAPIDRKDRVFYRALQQMAQLVRAHKLLKDGDTQAASKLIEQANLAYPDDPELKPYRDEFFTPNLELLREQIRLAPAQGQG